MPSSKNLKRSFYAALLALLAAFFAAGSATYAWYLYNTKAGTTNVHMAAGTTTSLEIANEYDGTYSSSTQLSTFEAFLNPVSTNNLQKGFRKVLGYTNGNENHLVARWFQSAQWEDYFQTKLFLRTRGGAMDLFVSDISFTDSSDTDPISCAIRVGLLVHEPGENQPAAAQYIFEINQNHVSVPEYNTYTGTDGYVLDLNADDPDTVVPFTPYNSGHFCSYDKETGIFSLKPDSLRLCSLPDSGESVEIEVFIWLEGCDSDCTLDIMHTYMDDMALSFAGVKA